MLLNLNTGYTDTDAGYPDATYLNTDYADTDADVLPSVT